jgi:hypothetical protein
MLVYYVSDIVFIDVIPVNSHTPICSRFSDMQVRQSRVEEEEYLFYGHSVKGSAMSLNIM